jgi:hypothetical protein
MIVIGDESVHSTAWEILDGPKLGPFPAFWDLSRPGRSLAMPSRKRTRDQDRQARKVAERLPSRHCRFCSAGRELRTTAILIGQLMIGVLLAQGHLQQLARRRVRQFVDEDHVVG